MKIVILDGRALNPGDLSWEPLNKLGEVVLYENSTQDELIERISDADAILINKVSITRDIMIACPNLKYIGVQATGYNVVDTEAAKELGITVTNVPAYSTEAVAQHTFALILAETNKVVQHHLEVKKGRWENAKDFYFLDGELMELSGKTIGLIGFGAIAQQVAKIARAFNLNVMTYTRTKKDGFPDISFVSKETLLAESDIISIHVPLSEETKNFIDQESLSQMKPSALLINTARGAIINETDLKDALNNGVIRYAGVDVAVHEPLNSDSPLLDADHIILSPHIAWAPFETRSRCINIVFDNIRGYVAGSPINVVNK